MSEESPLLINIHEGNSWTASVHESPSLNRSDSRRHVSSMWKWIALSFVAGGAISAIMIHTSTAKQGAYDTPPLLGSRRASFPNPGKRTENGVVPLPSEQDWCMAPGKYKFYGTYRSSATDDTGEDGIFYAPGRFEGIILTAQNDDVTYFHMVNMTYGNQLSPHHLPMENQEHDMLDVYCFLYNDPSKSSGCMAPKRFPKGQYANTRCGKLAFPSAPGNFLCRAMGMANFDFAGYHTMGAGDITVQDWQTRLSIDDPDAPNEYNGELHLYMRDAPADSPFPWKIPLVHWLTSDDQTLEASFQIMDWDPSWDPTTVPFPTGCHEAIDIAEEGGSRPNAWTLNGTATTATKCPFGAMHRHLVLPNWHRHLAAHP